MTVVEDLLEILLCGRGHPTVLLSHELFNEDLNKRLFREGVTIKRKSVKKSFSIFREMGAIARSFKKYV